MPLRSVRAVIAERMAHSATTAAHVTLTAEADATGLVDLRSQLLQDGVDAAYNDLFLYILGRALREYPQLNSSLENDTIKVWRRIHIGLAVDTDRGLLVPVVRDVDRKGLRQLAEESQSLVERARAGQCTPDELSHGTFTLTNLGMFGVDAFTPLINLPECAILGVGRIKKQPVMVGDQIVGRHMVWLSLTFDHRLVDGGPAARFLQRVVQLVERPHLLMT
jgi:pyruvate dehydrogenase E2 component (dihydrolipoamide acetyltransferase)